MRTAGVIPVVLLVSGCAMYWAPSESVQSDAAQEPLEAAAEDLADVTATPASLSPVDGSGLRDTALGSTTAAVALVLSPAAAASLPDSLGAAPLTLGPTPSVGLPSGSGPAPVGPAPVGPPPPTTGSPPVPTTGVPTGSTGNPSTGFAGSTTTGFTSPILTPVSFSPPTPPTPPTAPTTSFSSVGGAGAGAGAGAGP